MNLNTRPLPKGPITVSKTKPVKKVKKDTKTADKVMICNATYYRMRQKIGKLGIGQLVSEETFSKAIEDNFIDLL